MKNEKRDTWRAVRKSNLKTRRARKPGNLVASNMPVVHIRIHYEQVLIAKGVTSNWSQSQPPFATSSPAQDGG
jgi:hypothetical protein